MPTPPPPPERSLRPQIKPTFCLSRMNGQARTSQD